MRILYLLLMVITFSAHAGFLIDYQGLKPMEKKPKPEKEVPEGYKLLTDKYRGVVAVMGQGDFQKKSTFGINRSLKDAFSIIVPSEFVVYINVEFDSYPHVSWNARNKAWIDPLVEIGEKYGLKFVVDLDQKMVQITKNTSFVPGQLEAVAVTTDLNNEKLFIYREKDKPQFNKGSIIVDGVAYPVKLIDE